jgi:hypothetical protein
MAAGFTKAGLARAGVPAGPGPFVVHLRVAIGGDLTGRPAGLQGDGLALSGPAAGEPCHGPSAVAELGSVGGIRTADLAIGDVSAIGQSLRLHEHDSAHFAGEIHRIGRQAVAEVLIVLPRAGLVHKLERDRQYSHCSRLW